MKRGVFVGGVFVGTLAAAVLPVFKARFEDIAGISGLTTRNVYGGLERKDYILETTGNGVAIFDYDGDGRNDIFIANGARLNETGPRQPEIPQLYHNEGNGHFRNVAAEWALMESRAGRKGCVWEITIMMAIRISWSPITATTSCSGTAAMALSKT